MSIRLERVRGKSLRTHGTDSMLFANKRATRSSYPAELKSIMSVASGEESRKWLASWSGINRGPTPLYALNGLARKLGVAEILFKDESARSELGMALLKGIQKGAAAGWAKLSAWLSSLPGKISI